MFRSLSDYNYRVWFGGALVSNVGTWMQRTAQDWIVLTILTQNDAVAVGAVMALQLGPQLLLVPWTGLVADRVDRRKLLMATQGVMGILGLALGLIVLTGAAQLWQVYIFALLLGITSAFDAPARQSFVSNLVSDKNLSNAVALNSASFNAARMIGPALAGVLIAVVGSGWVFLINAASFGAVLFSLTRMRREDLRVPKRSKGGPGQLLDGFRYVSKRPDIIIVLVVIAIIGTFGLNFQIFTSTMTTATFHLDSTAFGLLSSVLAVGSVTGALLSARRERPRLGLMFASSALFGLSCLLGALAPTYLTFALCLVLLGFAAQTLMTTANGTVQMTTAPEFRGRVMALYVAIFMGGTPIGAPIVGWVANSFGPRWAIGVAAAAGFAAAIVGLVWMVRHQHLRLTMQLHSSPHFIVSHDGDTRSLDLLETHPTATIERDRLADDLLEDEVADKR
ncbi:MFS transporter [Subtercola boreus]|uniref:MFS transporter n=1 Tax=Subtercola boreus TaxID=120213 RepID=A0A3E0WCI1_9MICO|nr:MFS transporter [Subtercola boreus]RFA20250.1 MFS transporter [Subtercola boreus]RFA20402.1 MFS transporter [Subtercola boreus]RFA26654.1 MFS transporter [Subtercola boreus]